MLQLATTVRMCPVLDADVRFCRMRLRMVNAENNVADALMGTGECEIDKNRGCHRQLCPPK